MAQDPEDREEEQEETALDTSHDLDMVPLYDSMTIDAQPEADVIRGILDASGIPSLVPQESFPNLGFAVMVPKARAEEARRLVEEALAAGPEAAAEAEAASEEGS